MQDYVNSDYLETAFAMRCPAAARRKIIAGSCPRASADEILHRSREE